MNLFRTSTLGRAVFHVKPKVGRPARTVAVSPRLRKLGIALAAAALGLLLAPIVAVLVGYGYYIASGRIMPGVSVGGMPLQGMTVTEAAQALDRQWNQDFRLPAVDTSKPTRSLVSRPSDFGLGVDALASAQEAFGAGRAQGPLVGVRQFVQNLRSGRELQPIAAFDPAAARAGLAQWSEAMDVAPVEGILEVQQGVVLQQNGLPGKTLDIESTVALLQIDPDSILFTYAFVPLVMTPVQPQIVDVSSAAAEAERLLSAPVSLVAYDPVTDAHFDWAPSREEIASWIQIDRGQNAYRVLLDEARVAAWVEEQNASLGEERFLDTAAARQALVAAFSGQGSDPLIVHYRPTTYVVGRGETLISVGFHVGMPYWRLAEANPQTTGRSLIPGETLTIPPRDINMALPIVLNKRIIISITEQRLWTYEDGQLLAEHVISTGIASSPTMPGVFQVQSHILDAYASRWDLYMPHFLGIYEAVPGFWNGIHGLPMLHSGVRLWANVLGRPASYGCIILTLEEAETMYSWAEDGVVVEIQP
jgi:lipoprotein-anchoring transpeptidase ErfK/SrfK